MIHFPGTQCAFCLCRNTPLKDVPDHHNNPSMIIILQTVRYSSAQGFDILEHLLDSE